MAKKKVPKLRASFADRGEARRVYLNSKDSKEIRRAKEYLESSSQLQEDRERIADWWAKPRVNKFMDVLSQVLDFADMGAPAALGTVITPGMMTKSKLKDVFKQDIPLETFAKRQRELKGSRLTKGPGIPSERIPKSEIGELRHETAKTVAQARRAFKPQSEGRRVLVDRMSGGLMLEPSTSEALAKEAGLKLPKGRAVTGLATPELGLARTHKEAQLTGFAPRSQIRISRGRTAAERAQSGKHELAHVAQGAQTGPLPPSEDALRRVASGEFPTSTAAAGESFADWFKEYIQGNVVPEQVSNFFRNLGGKFQSGGPIPNQNSSVNMPKAKVRLPAADIIQQMQSGGLVGELINNLRNINVDTSQMGNMANSLAGVGGQLGGFNPFVGSTGAGARGTLEEMLGTGAPTDVAPITEAATMDAQKLFGDLMGNVNEGFGALGLGSSSARQRALSRGASDISTGVGAEGLRAGVGAQESASNRRMGAFSPFFQGTGQQLTGLTGAGQAYLGAGNLRGQQAGLGLQSQLGQTGGQQNLAGSLIPPQAQQMNQLPQQQNPQPVPTGRPAGGGGGGGGVSRSPMGPLLNTRIKRPGSVSSGFGGVQSFGGGEVGPASSDVNRRWATSGMFQGGGRIDYGDHLSNLLFGREFHRREPIEMPRYQQPVRQPRQQQIPSGLGNLLQNLMRQNTGPSKGVLSGGKFASEPWRFADIFKHGLANPWARVALTRQIQENPLTSKGDITWPKPLPGPLPRQRGGLIEGPAVPPDQVPIMAQGGEGVIPVGLMDELEKSPSDDPIVMKLKELMGFANAPEMGCGGKVKYQSGGEVTTQEQFRLPQGMRADPGASIPTITDPSQYVQDMGLQQGGAGTFSQMGVSDPSSDLELKRANAEKRLALLRSAIATAANPERATALLTPRVEEAQAELAMVVGEQDALRARQMEEVRAQLQFQAQQEQTASRERMTEKGLAQEKEQFETGQAAEQEQFQEAQAAQQQAQGQATFMALMQQQLDAGRTPASAYQIAMSISPPDGIPPDAEQVLGQLQAVEAQESARLLNEDLRGISFEDLDEEQAAAAIQAVNRINEEGMPEEEVMQTYPELYRLAQEMTSAPQQERMRTLLSGASQGIIPPEILKLFGG